MFDQVTQRLLEKDIFSDDLIRWAIRKRLAKKLALEKEGGAEQIRRRKQALVEKLRQSPIAVETKKANEQHYEVPTEFYLETLGKYLKYSSGYWPPSISDLDGSEKAMLDLTIARAELAPGQTILELGCGWGSLTLYMAQKFPDNSITAISNSKTQKQFIETQAQTRGLKNIRVVTADINQFEAGALFDRIVSVEMFEHMRNYEKLFEKVSGWLKEDGKVFVHVFTHRECAYLFTEEDETDWMARYFFSGGTMPSHDLFFYFQKHLSVKQHWLCSGTHYEKTSNAWLQKMDDRDSQIFPILQKTYGKDAKKWRVYWRVFFMACAELFGYQNGSEWSVSHYLFTKTRT